MSVMLDWYIPERCLHIVGEGLLSFDDMVEALDAAADVTQNSQSTIHILFDMSRILGFPTDFHYLLGDSGLFDDSKLGWLIFTGNDQIVRYLQSSPILGYDQIRAYTEIDHAITFLHRADLTLPNTPIYNEAISISH